MAIPNLRPEDLPAWMRPRRRTFDWGLLIILGFCLVVAWPLVTRHGPPINTNAELYELRSLEIAHLLRAGILFSRWGPDLNYGYGSPLFNYLPPLPHYLPAYHQTLTDTSAADSIDLFLALSVVAAGSGMFVFARQRWGAAAGLVAALVYLFSPPIALTLPFLDGDLALLMALGILPWALWALDHCYLNPQPRMFILAVGLLSALLLSDTRIALMALPVIALALASVRQHGSGMARGVIGVLLVSALLTAYFWLPALVERDQVRWTAYQSDSHAGSVPLAEILGGVPRPDAHILNPPTYRGVGVGTWLLALVGIAALALRRKPFATDAALFLALGLILIAVSTPAFGGLWPAPDTFQPPMPYHALLVAAFCLALVAGQTVRLLDVISARWRPLGLAALCLAVPLVSLAALNPPIHDLQTSNPDFITGVQYEVHGYHTGTFRDGALLPATASELPPPPANLVRDMEADNLDRVSRRSYSAGAQVNPIERGPISSRYIFEMTQPGDIEFNIFYYPGWSATIDGQRWSVQPSAQGLAKVSISKQSGELGLWLEGTPVRYVAWVITLFGVILTLLMARRVASGGDHDPVLAVLSGREVVAVSVALALSAGVAVWIGQQTNVPLALSPGSPTITPLAHTFNTGMRLIGCNVPTSAGKPGEQVNLTLFWQAPQPIVDNNQSEVRLVSTQTQQPIASWIHRHPGGVPTSRWSGDSIIRDDFTLTLPTAVPAGDYQWQILTLACDSPMPCAAESQPGGAAQDVVAIPSLSADWLNYR